MYFDYLATTPTDEEVLETMSSCARDIIGNPHSSDHIYGQEAAELVEIAKATLSTLLPNEQQNSGDWIFTSGATEANNLALKGIYEHAQFSGVTKTRNKILISAIEHPCILEAAEYLQKRGAEVIKLPVDNAGRLDLEEFTKLADKDVLIVSVMWANNETGVIQPIKEITQICAEHKIIFHSDAAQTAGKIPMEVTSDLYPDLISISGHKFYGPRSIGALWIKKEIAELIEPQIHGGGQQDGLRSGTLAVPLCIGLAKAADIAAEKMDEESKRLQAMRDEFEHILSSAFDDLRINGAEVPRLPHASHFQIPHVDMGDLLSACPEIAVSRGSACASEDTTKVSHVLAAMRMEFFAHECLRVSFGRMSTHDEMISLAEAIIEIAKNIRS